MQMSKSVAYAEVDAIIELMDKEHQDLVPRELRYIINSQKDLTHKKEIDVTKPLINQNINKEALAILTMINYEYWCKSKREKNDLLKAIAINELKFREKYNPNNLFKKVDKNLQNHESKNNLVLVSKNKIIQKIINKIKQLLRK